MKKKMTSEEKLVYAQAMLEATAGSVTDYSAKALIDRMKWLAAFLKDDERGIEKYGRLCYKEQHEQHPEIYGKYSLDMQ